MNKSEYIDAIAKMTGYSKAQTADFVNASINVTTKTLKKGEPVQITGFGTWSVAKRAARTGRNPATGKTLKIAACKSPKFKAGALLKKAVK